MGAPELFSRAPLTNKEARRRLLRKLPLWAAAAALAGFVALTAVELWMPRTAARLASWGVLPGASVVPGRPGEAVPRPSAGAPVRDGRDPRLDGPADRPLAALSGRADPGSPMDVLIPGEAVNAGLKVRPDARRRDRISGAGAPSVVDEEAERLREAAAARAAAADEARREVLRGRLRAAAAAAALGLFIALVPSGFLRSLLLPRRP